MTNGTDEICYQVHPRLVRSEIDFFEGRREAFTVASKWHLMNETDVVFHVLHHVKERVLLHSNPRIGNHYELVLCVVIASAQIVDFWIDSNVCSAEEELRFDFRIFFYQMLHYDQGRIFFVFDAEQQLERWILHGEEGFKVL